MKFICRLCILILVVSANLFALKAMAEPALVETAAIETARIETIVVSGTRTPKLLNNSPVSVDVIDAEKIELVAAQGTLADALNIIPGVVITRSQKDGYNVQMRGFESDHILILLDNQPIISPTGSSVDLDQINASDVAQIEVIKGPASVLYGSSAMGGVINIITKQDYEPHLTLNYQLSQYKDAELEDSHPLSSVVTISAARALSGIDHKLILKVIDQAGFDYDLDTVAQDAASSEKVFLDYTAQAQFSDLDAHFKYQFIDHYKEKNTSIIPGNNSLLFYSSDVQQNQLNVGFTNSDLSNNWRSNLRYISHEEISGSSNGLRDTDIKLVEVDGQKVWQAGNVNPKTDKEWGSEVVIGGLVHFDNLDQIKVIGGTIEIDDESRQSLELFTQHNLIFNDKQFLIGIRAQDDSDFGINTATKISSLVKFEWANMPISWRLGIGDGYRVPNLKERFYVFDHSNLGYKVLGNVDLKPETSFSMTSSLSLQSSLFNDNADWTIELSGHLSNTENLISTVSNPELSEQENLDISQYINVNEAQIYGFDISSELSFEHWQWKVDYSYVESKDRATNKRLENRPRHQLKASASYQFDQPNLYSMLYLVHQSDEAIPNDMEVINNHFTTVHFSLTFSLTQRLSWRMSINNIFDAHKDPKSNSPAFFDARPVSSREIALGITYKF